MKKLVTQVLFRFFVHLKIIGPLLTKYSVLDGPQLSVYKVLGLSLDLQTDYPIRNFRGFSQFIQANIGIKAQIRPKAFPVTFLTFITLIIKHVPVEIHAQSLTMSLNKKYTHKYD
jgi:hypothetical protein